MFDNGTKLLIKKLEDENKYLRDLVDRLLEASGRKPVQQSLSTEKPLDQVLSDAEAASGKETIGG